MNVAQPSREKAANAGVKAKPQPDLVEKPDALEALSVYAGGKASAPPQRDGNGHQPSRPGLSVPAHLQQSFGNQAMLRGMESGLELAGLDQLLPLQPIIGNQGVTRRLQTKLRINTPGDQYEQEADRVAEQVMRMPAQGAGVALSTLPVASGVQRKCACSGSGDKCDQCREEEPMLQRSASSPAAFPYAPAIVHDVLRSRGQPLDSATRAFMEPRFGQDFSKVRVHTDLKAAESAEAVQARAYTVGREVVFGTGQFIPATPAGQRLLAHELTHVTQQSGVERFHGDRGKALSSLPSIARSDDAVQRKCRKELGDPKPDCTELKQGAAGLQFMFKVGCDELLPGEEGKLSQLKPGRKLKIHGFASKEGDPDFNMALSCHRANVIAGLAKTKRPDCPFLGTFKHGASPVMGPGLGKDVNPPDYWRSVLIEEVRPTREEWLDPSSIIAQGWTLYNRAINHPEQANLDAAAAHRVNIKAWFESVPKSLAPSRAQLDRKDLTDYRQFSASARMLWTSIDKMLADQGDAAAFVDTYAVWEAGSGRDQGPALHAKHVPTGAQYHIDLFGEGFFPGAINIGMAERSSTTGVPGTRVPNLIYRKFSAKDAAVNKLPIADHVADLVTSENGPLMFAGLIDEIARIIAPGGTIILYGPSNMEIYHDQMAKVVGGTIKKEKDADGLESIIQVP